MSDSVITHRRRTVVSPWVTLVERAVGPGDGAPASLQLFHSLAQADYVTLLPETDDGRIVLVEQFRPALERRTLELPGGLLDPGEDPARCAARELAEETGYEVAGAPTLLGSPVADTGRLENRIWCFHARPVAPLADWTPEPGVARHLVTKDDFKAMILDGRFDHALHIAIVGMALLRGVFR